MRHGGGVQHGVVAPFGLGRQDIADGREQAEVVEPVYQFELGVFHDLK